MSSRPIKLEVCTECDGRTLHYLDTAECMICGVDSEPILGAQRVSKGYRRGDYDG